MAKKHQSSWAPNFLFPNIWSTLRMPESKREYPLPPQRRNSLLSGAGLWWKPTCTAYR